MKIVAIRNRLMRVERDLGRVRPDPVRWGPRTIDLDILWIEGEAIESDGRILKTGDFVSFKPGSFHNTRTETGCLMIVFEWAPA